ncbi:CBS domain-containing protein [Erythrobacter aureus]|uniref:CBS domain-containing protein n=1 Tax=Erythrobacter aureus TaxID=2182384 RepID=A0A345YBS0_9SPHN|nr:CBS domain-containing protein [Erythrobacter aureus]AXK41372.1 CBS domain-containing protein [Erythrobacter aureus]MBL45784.1 histidine kinase [Sphingomonadaceae bacterium]
MEIRRLIEGRASSDIISCALDIPVREAIALLASKRIGAIPVTEHGKVVGIFSERDVIYRLADEGDACLSRPLGDVMTAPAITVNRDTPVLEALALMTRRRIRHLPVVDGAEMCGFISIGDLVKARLDEIQHEAEAMREYIQTA